MVVRSVRAPSDQYGVTVQSVQPSTLDSAAVRPATPSVKSAPYWKWYSPTVVGVPEMVGVVA
jgi:hypothetical protein